MKYHAMLLADFYKISHRCQYPKDTTKVYATWTPRGCRIAGCEEFVWFGMQPFLKNWLVDFFTEHFFNRDIEEICAEYSRLIRCTLGDPNPETQHIRDLHALGYLPLRIRALDEGTKVAMRTPVLTIENTDDRFFWVTNYVETLMSCELWQASTSATMAREFRKVFDRYAMETVGNTDFSGFQGHDFSFRGMPGVEAATLSGLGHLTSFVGTDTIPAICAAEELYGANVETELVGTSVPATEHSVQCTYGDDDKYIKTMIMEVHPNGLVSVVSDGYDFWDVINRVIPSLKDEILARDGKLVIRPDSGDPVKIICGDPEASTEWEQKGAVRRLWEIFGGTQTPKGFSQLDSHIGLIYGDAITLERQKKILGLLKDDGFASTNVVLGIGSFTYQYVTRDTFGLALKSTMAVRGGKEVQIFKTPKTDNGLKYSQRGRVAVTRDHDGKIVWRDKLSFTEHVPGNLLLDRFVNGKLVNETTFAEVRARVAS